MNRATRVILAAVMVLGLLGCSSNGSPRPADALPPFLSAVPVDARNAARTCAGRSIPNLAPTDTCAAWGKPVIAPWGYALDVQAGRLHIATTPDASGVVRACTKVSYHNRSRRRVGLNPENWVLLLPFSGPPTAYPPQTFTNLGSSLTPSGASPLPPGGHARGQLCFNVQASVHGRFVLRVDAPVPTADATSVFWITRL